MNPANKRSSSQLLSETHEVKAEYDDFGFVKRYVCPSCKGKVKLSHEDDTGTKWFQCDKCGQYSTKLKSPERKQLETSLEDLAHAVKIGDLTICPFLNSNSKEIHPTIGCAENIGYVGVWIPCEIVDQRGKPSFKDLLWLITSKREITLANDDTLRNHGWRLAHKPLRFQNRWNLNYVKAWLKGASVTPEEVLTRTISVWKEYIEFPDEKESLYHTLWDIGTYFHHLFNTYPYLYIGGVKRCGKTKVLTLHSCLSHNAFFSNNMSASSIYRLIQNARGTLLIDETEKLSSSRHMSERTLEYRSILLAGYKRGGKCYRVEKTRQDVLQPKAFEVYGPKALANIQGLEDVLEDRCKTTVLKRSLNKAIANHEPDINDPRWNELRNELYIFYLTYWREIKDIYNELSEHSEPVNLKIARSLSKEEKQGLEYVASRELELWKPIFTLAIFFDKKECNKNKFTSSPSSPHSLTKQMLKLAIENAGQRHTENMTETGETILVQVLRRLVNQDRYYKVKLLKEEMMTEFDEEQKWLTTRWIGSALRRLGFKEKRRVGTGYEYFFKKLDVDDLAERMQVVETNEEVSQQTRKKSPTAQEVLQQIRNRFVEGTKEEWIALAVENGLPQKDAENLFEQLAKSELFWFDRDGKACWRWANK
ncbi:MAG: hypothetical protein O2V44_09630 [Candidatus Bathyarchaeota archaeon]|nr:hypothetical protein [Candidatus Bathyarchaeota archaeon]